MKAIDAETKQLYHHRLLLVVGLLLLFSGLMCICDNNGPTETPEVKPVPPAEAGPGPEGGPGQQPGIGELQVKAQVKRRSAEVWAGSGEVNQLPRLDEDHWYDLSIGSYITTDDTGEGWIRLSDCMDIYIFRTSKLLASACPRSTQLGGNVTCAEQGTSVFNNNCASRVVIQTPSMEIELEGTWLIVTYLPDRQLSILQVWQGVAIVQPVLNVERYNLGEAIPVETGKSWFSVPDNRLGELGNLSFRTPLDSLPPEINELVQPWQPQVLAQAAQDGVPMPAQPAGFILINGGGGPLEDKRVEDAVKYAIDWPALKQNIFPNQESSIFVELPEERQIREKIGPNAALLNEVTAWSYDPEQSRRLMAEAGFPNGINLMLVYPAEDAQLARMAETMTGYLNEVGVETASYQEPSYSIPDLAMTTMSAGQPILWLSRQ